MSPSTPRWRALSELGRPFTLLAPAIGVLSGGLTAVGAAPRDAWQIEMLWYPFLGALAAVVLNAASNALNQIFDLAIDGINKPFRPLPSGRLTLAEAWTFTLSAFAFAWILAWLVAPAGRHEFFWLVLAATVITAAYSVPPLRTKQRLFLANLTIAIPRGVLLKVAGWSTVKSMAMPEAWYIGAIFGLFLLGATTTKDFADMEGDRRGGCRTLPLAFGVTRAAWLIAPSFVAPFLLINAGVAAGWLTGNAPLLHGLGMVLAGSGSYVCFLMLRRPDDLAVDENHVSWTHMYRMLLLAQTGLAAAYLVP